MYLAPNFKIYLNKVESSIFKIIPRRLLYDYFLSSYNDSMINKYSNTYLRSIGQKAIGWDNPDIVSEQRTSRYINEESVKIYYPMLDWFRSILWELFHERGISN